jgi:RNA polymerase sigma-70 factor (ECF subfamily)
MSPEPADLIPTRSSLLSRVKDWHDLEGWQQFFDTYWKLIYNTARKAGLTDSEAQDVVQDTLLSVAKKMPEFNYDSAAGSFKTWLLQLTHWRILNQLKKRRPDGRFALPRTDTSDRTATIERVPDPAFADLADYWDREWHKNLVDAALQRVKDKVSPKQYEIFYLAVIKQLPAGKVAASLKVNRARVYLAKHRVSALVKKEVQALERQAELSTKTRLKNLHATL